MKKYLFLILLLLPLTIFSQRLRTEGKYIVDSNDDEVILRGVGLGGWMLMEGYMMQSSDVADTQHEFRAKLEELMGVEKTDQFFDAWLANHVTKKDIDSLAAWGFNSVRLPMHYNLFTLPIEDEPITGENTWLPKGFEMVDELLIWCKENSIYLILDLHGAPGGQGENASISDYDPTKPSLWESKENRDKTVALWTKLAERYKDEDWIGGYDLINETNWYKDDMGSNNFLLRQLMGEITDSIRSIGDNHIVFIEGNSWANDFNGMTPPWDDNMAYSFHKYWSHNDPGSIQWVLDIRNQHNVPLWMGEAGENSNVWFTEAISLFEENKIGWSWWPMKRIENIVSPYSIKFTEGYKKVLSYWRGEIPKPSEEDAYQWMMELAQNANSANCDYVKGVTDAMIIQPHTTERRPYANHSLPGTVFLTDYDMGVIGSAYFDTNFANYSLSTGSFQAWNDGWWYRNDGVDIEKTDIPGGNGFNVGFVEKGEWMKYTVLIDKAGVYDIDLQYAATQSGAQVHLALDDVDITQVITLAGTGGWTAYDIHTIDDIILPVGEHTITFFIDNDKKANFSRMDFTFKSETIDIPFTVLTSTTEKTENSVKVTFNYSFDPATLTSAAPDFELKVNGEAVTPASINYTEGEPNSIELMFESLLHYQDNLQLNYSGSTLRDLSGKTLEVFTDLIVLNDLDPRWILPGRIQAEAYSSMVGFQEEACEDTGGGINLGYADFGDYADYSIRVEEEMEFEISFRVASQSSQGRVKLFIVKDDSEEELGTYTFPSTGGWQKWVTTSDKISLPAGDHTLRLTVANGGFNLNWFEFDDIVLGLREELEKSNIGFYPNPTSGYITITEQGIKKYQILSLQGRVIEMNEVASDRQVNLKSLDPGHYLLVLIDSNNTSRPAQKLIVE